MVCIEVNIQNIFTNTQAQHWLYTTYTYIAMYLMPYAYNDLSYELCINFTDAWNLVSHVCDITKDRHFTYVGLFTQIYSAEQFNNKLDNFLHNAWSIFSQNNSSL